MRFNAPFFKTVGLYLVAMATILALMWLALNAFSPGAGTDLIRGVAAILNIDIPDSMVSSSATLRGAFFVSVLTLLGVMILIVHVVFEARVTEHLIVPKVNLVTSRRGAWSNSWAPGREHILVRLVNFQGGDLVDVDIACVVSVEEKNVGKDGDEDRFICYFPVPAEAVTPARALVLEDRAPWSISVPADVKLGNSLAQDYKLDLGKPIVDSFAKAKGRKLVSCKRKLEILIKGMDVDSYAGFVVLRRIDLDEQSEGGIYTLHLHKGAFKSLPLRVSSAADVEQYVPVAGWS